MRTGTSPDRYQAEDAFLDTLHTTAERNGRRSSLRLASELERLTSSRTDWTPKQLPSAKNLGICLKTGPDQTADLRGTIAGFQQKLKWESAPKSPEQGAFANRHAYTTLVGPGCRIPSSRLMVGLFIVDPDTYYPPHAHAAEELYLPLSGSALYSTGDNPPTLREPGTFLRHKPWETHTMWTGGAPTLILWVWMGEINGPYKMVS